MTVIAFPTYTITDYTREFARSAGGYRGDSPAMLHAMEAIRQHGIRRARDGHFERKAVIDEMKANPEMFFNAIRPNLCTAEAIEAANRVIFGFRNLPTWQRERRLADVQRAQKMRVYARFFRRFGKRLWIRSAA
ncbi:hypothetical protein NL532_24295 [Mesorhizobium sp. C120A]|uniref:hypothetical protein n=1 Tax=unclassified Mesorhizobium TaxID=325217 RepID=UPI0003D0404D|nr:MULTISPECIES: hypothetical protein [unclassified Mesorhizobium]ESZ60511.1 hypothetical protein X728_15250 [Mesorhizobium sp. L103C120A0]WJI43731.1 hypothetical protein NL532_24295 [Mesorhizobium sp. C120A]